MAVSVAIGSGACWAPAGSAARQRSRSGRCQCSLHPPNAGEGESAFRAARRPGLRVAAAEEPAEFAIPHSFPREAVRRRGTWAAGQSTAPCIAQTADCRLQAADCRPGRRVTAPAGPLPFSSGGGVPVFDKRGMATFSTFTTTKLLFGSRFAPGRLRPRLVGSLPLLQTTREGGVFNLCNYYFEKVRKGCGASDRSDLDCRADAGDPSPAGRQTYAWPFAWLM